MAQHAQRAEQRQIVAERAPVRGRLGDEVVEAQRLGEPDLERPQPRPERPDEADAVVDPRREAVVVGDLEVSRVAGDQEVVVDLQRQRVAFFDAQVGAALGVELLRRADAIFIEELRAAGWYDKTSQAFAVFLPVKSVGVMGDGRTYEYVVALRAVQTQDFMTAHWAELPHSLLGKVSNRIINEDENLFLRMLETGEGNLEAVYYACKETGEITDDFSLISLTYLRELETKDTRLGIGNKITEARALVAKKNYSAATALLWLLAAAWLVTAPAHAASGGAE